MKRYARKMSGTRALNMHKSALSLSDTQSQAQDVCTYEINIDQLFLRHRGDSHSFERSGCLCVCSACAPMRGWVLRLLINHES